MENQPKKANPLAETPTKPVTCRLGTESHRDGRLPIVPDTIPVGNPSPDISHESPWFRADGEYNKEFIQRRYGLSNDTEQGRLLAQVVESHELFPSFASFSPRKKAVMVLLFIEKAYTVQHQPLPCTNVLVEMLLCHPLGRVKVWFKVYRPKRNDRNPADIWECQLRWKTLAEVVYDAQRSLSHNYELPFARYHKIASPNAASYYNLPDESFFAALYSQLGGISPMALAQIICEDEETALCSGDYFNIHYSAQHEAQHRWLNWWQVADHIRNNAVRLPWRDDVTGDVIDLRVGEPLDDKDTYDLQANNNGN